MTHKFEEHQGLVHLQAQAGFKWAQSVGLTMLSYDDMFQEASMAFVLADRGFDKDAGVKFSAYFTKVAHSQFRKIIGQLTGVKNINPTQRAEIQARRQENSTRAAAGRQQLPDVCYIVPTTSIHDLAYGVDEEGTRSDPSWDMIDSGVSSPEELMEFKQLMERAVVRLSPLAALVVEWLRDPPPELMREIHAQLAYAERCYEEDVRTTSLRRGLSLYSITKFIRMLGVEVKPRDLERAKTELARLTSELEAA